MLQSLEATKLQQEGYPERKITIIMPYWPMLDLNFPDYIKALHSYLQYGLYSRVNYSSWITLLYPKFMFMGAGYEASPAHLGRCLFAKSYIRCSDG